MEPTDDDYIIYEMEVRMALDSLEERGLVERFVLDGEEYYKLTEAGVEEAENRAHALGYESLDALSQAYMSDEEDEDEDPPYHLN